MSKRLPPCRRKACRDLLARAKELARFEAEETQEQWGKWRDAVEEYRKLELLCQKAVSGDPVAIAQLIDMFTEEHGPPYK